MKCRLVTLLHMQRIRGNVSQNSIPHRKLKLRSVSIRDESSFYTPTTGDLFPIEYCSGLDAANRATGEENAHAAIRVTIWQVLELKCG